MGPTFSFVSAGNREHIAQIAVLRRRLYPWWVSFACVFAVAIPMIGGAAAGFFIGLWVGLGQNTSLLMLAGMGAGYFLLVPRTIAAVNAWGLRKAGGSAARTDIPTTFFLD